MLCIPRTGTNPFFNLAAEEYLLKNFKGDVFSIWINDPCVVVGKHQNTLAEVNYHYLKEMQIPVLRRITGGGAVFHDQGNINFSFITSGERHKLVDYRRSTLPLIRFLDSLGVKAAFEGKSNLTIDGRKFSGNSAHVYKDRVIHHGTAMFSSDIQRLNQSLNRSAGKLSDKSVHSVRAQVTNIQDHLQVKMTPYEFRESFFRFVVNNHPGSDIYKLTAEQETEIGKLAETKYRTWEWVYGYSPDYTLDSEMNNLSKTWSIRLSVSKGIILNCTITDEKGIQFVELEKLITGLPHREDRLGDSLGNINFADYYPEFDIYSFIRNIF